MIVLSRCTNGQPDASAASKPNFVRVMANNSEEDFSICFITSFHSFLTKKLLPLQLANL